VRQWKTTKETYKRDLQKRPTKEIYKRDLQKRFTKETTVAGRQWKTTRDLQKRPTKETYKRDLQKRQNPRGVSGTGACVRVEIVEDAHDVG
jgi:hypothetical protein